MFKKGQVEIREMLLTIIVAGILFAVGVLIFANVSNVTQTILDPTTDQTTNETLTIFTDSLNSDNSTLLAKSGYIENTETVVNASAPFVSLTRDVEYKITLTAGSGDLTNRGNFTLLNITTFTGNESTFNNSQLFISYQFNKKSPAQISTENLETTVLDSFSLGVIALIVLAAVAILAILFKLGT